MWGFDSSSFSDLARSAISGAQKQIDKVLEIEESQDPLKSPSAANNTSERSKRESSTRPNAGPSGTHRASASRKEAKKKPSDEKSFWDTFLRNDDSGTSETSRDGASLSGASVSGSSLRSPTSSKQQRDRSPAPKRSSSREGEDFKRDNSGVNEEGKVDGAAGRLVRPGRERSSASSGTSSGERREGKPSPKDPPTDNNLPPVTVEANERFAHEKAEIIDADVADKGGSSKEKKTEKTTAPQKSTLELASDYRASPPDQTGKRRSKPMTLGKRKTKDVASKEVSSNNSPGVCKKSAVGDQAPSGDSVSRPIVGAQFNPSTETRPRIGTSTPASLVGIGQPAGNEELLTTSITSNVSTSSGDASSSQAAVLKSVPIETDAHAVSFRTDEVDIQTGWGNDADGWQTEDCDGQVSTPQSAFDDNIIDPANAQVNFVEGFVSRGTEGGAGPMEAALKAEILPQMSTELAAAAVVEGAATGGKMANVESTLANGSISTHLLAGSEEVTMVTDPDTSAGQANEGDRMRRREEGRVITNADDVQCLQKELEECRRILEVRETKMVELSRRSIDFQESNNILRSQLEQLENLRRSETADVDRLTSEFTERLSDMEHRSQLAIRERDQLRKEVEALQGESTDEVRAHYESVLQQKEESIKGLMEEGEKLSKQQLQNSKIIKKLRTKEKDLDAQLISVQKELEEANATIARHNLDVKKWEETERKYQTSLGKVNSVAEQQGSELLSVKSDLENNLEKVRGLQSALDNAYKEIATLQKANAANQSAAQEAALSAEVQARSLLKNELDRLRTDTQKEQEGLLLQITDLRANLSRSEQLASRREDHLRQEIGDLQERLQIAEGHSQELTNSVSVATRPLLRQIESLQSSHSAQVSSWERLERNLTERLGDAQSQLAEASERERLASERVMELQTRLNSMESSTSMQRQDKSRLIAELELVRTKLDTLEEERSSSAAKLIAVRESYQHEVQDLRKTKMSLEKQVTLESSRADAEERRARVAEEALEKERVRHRQAIEDLRESVPPSPAQTPTSVGPGRPLFPNQGDILEQSLHGSLYARRSSPSDLSDGVSTPRLPVAVGLERLQSLLKQKEGEVAALQNQVALLEKTRSSVAEQLVQLASQNEALQAELVELPTLKDQLQDVNERYNTMLQLYGEKAEEADELRMDLQDVKAMYKQQINDLLSRR